MVYASCLTRRRLFCRCHLSQIAPEYICEPYPGRFLVACLTLVEKYFTLARPGFGFSEPLKTLRCTLKASSSDLYLKLISSFSYLSSFSFFLYDRALLSPKSNEGVRQDTLPIEV